jgi:hypothetical protein
MAARRDKFGRIYVPVDSGSYYFFRYMEEGTGIEFSPSGREPDAKFYLFTDLVGPDRSSSLKNPFFIEIGSVEELDAKFDDKGGTDEEIEVFDDTDAGRSDGNRFAQERGYDIHLTRRSR